MADRASSFPPASFLATLDDASRTSLVEAGRGMSLPDGSSLLFEGDDSGRMIVILAGSVRVFSTAANGREVLVTVVGPGEILGEMSALDGVPHSASATTVGDTEVVMVPGDAFRALMASNAALATGVALRLTRELRRMMHQRVDLEAFDVPTRLARILVDRADEAEPHGDGPIELPISQHELAEACGASREAVTKALGTFRARGWVRTERRSITIVDPEALRARAT
jgi:CRP/FNR family cyclic AMP-dependent transcriptional regulator